MQNQSQVKYGKKVKGLKKLDQTYTGVLIVTGTIRRTGKQSTGVSYNCVWDAHGAIVSANSIPAADMSPKLKDDLTLVLP